LPLSNATDHTYVLLQCSYLGTIICVRAHAPERPPPQLPLLVHLNTVFDPPLHPWLLSDAHLACAYHLLTVHLLPP
jgi:hypothetical protein